MNVSPRRILAEFAAHEALVGALRRLRDERYSHLEVYTPFPSDAIDELLPGKSTRIGWLMLAGGIVGGSGAYFLQWFAARDYAYNAGGRPLHSWPAFVPVTFELTVLTAALVGFASLLWLARLPRLDHPVFDAPEFRRASQDRFFLAVRTDDPRLTSVGVEPLLRECGAVSIQEVAG
ncbi:MAG TPA: DUF3341 domain-containing protein [Opitutaceae bacterium]|nr:DUF3341 domain-containing protein [Opitutaceae bacterium]